MTVCLVFCEVKYEFCEVECVCLTRERASEEVEKLKKLNPDERYQYYFREFEVDE